MKKACANGWCAKSFDVTEDDLAFYEKVSPVFGGKKYLIPPPTLCPTCRMIRRMCWRNERSLYRRRCDSSGKSIISSFSSDTSFPVYERSEWLGDGWDSMSFGAPLKLDQSFFSQCADLMRVVPRAALNGKNTENCEYSNFCFDSRNCYLTPCCYYSESVLYSYWMLNSKDCVDCSYLYKSEQCYECSDCNNAYACRFCTLCHSCNECSHCFDCIGCSACVGCVGLRHKQYCMFNEQLTQTEYEQTVRSMHHRVASDASFLRRLQQLLATHPRRASTQEKTIECTGDYIFESARCTACFQAFRSEDCVNVHDADDVKDSRDTYHAGWSQLLYETYSPVRLHMSAFTSQCWDGSHLLYCDTCQSCSHCVGCVALKHAKYCILNRQYTQEEYDHLVPKLIERMRSDGEWGEFFPQSLSPFAYNETIAQEYVPINKEQAHTRSLRWSDYEAPFPQVKNIIPAKDLPDSIDNIPDDIMNWAIECQTTKKPFRIIKPELEFYRNMHLPIPLIHPDERHRRRMALRNPRTLWNRQCVKCQNSIVTSYSPDRPEIVYCESCYLATVY